MNNISKISVNGTIYGIVDTITTINGKSGVIAASDIATVLSAAGYKLTDDNTVTSINGKTGAITASDIASVLIAAGYELTDLVNHSEMGVAGGVATLDATGKVPSSQLPSYVDDVVEYASRSAFPETGETGKIYVDIAANETYRWSGSQYVIISDSQVQANWNTTDATSKSYIQNKPTNVSSFTNDAGYLTQHQDISGKADKTATVSDVAYDSTNKKITKTINGTTSDVVTVSTIKSDLNLSKSDVGLGNVTNDAQVKRSEMGEANGVATLDEDGHLEAEQLEDVYDSISDLQTQIDNIDDGYGIQWTNVNTSPVRIGNMKLHRTLPIQSKMRRYIKTANGIKKFISDTDYTKYEDGTTVNYQSDGELFVVVPKYWYTANKKVVDGVNQYDLTLYNRHVAGAKESKEVHISAVEASSDDAINATPSLYSIIKANVLYNNDGSVDASNLTYAEDATSYRGGNARSNNTNDTDTGAKCMLGRPVTSLTRAAFRERAARRGTGYSQQYWTAYMAWVRLYVVEYCSFNSQASYNENKTTEGYMQGGLGAGVSAISNWSDLNGYNPVVPCGITIRLGNKTGVVTYRTDSQTTYVPSYRGIENPFGEIWKWTDGLNQHDTEIYVCDDITKFADDTSTGYELRGNCATGGWIKDVIWDENGEFIPSAVGGSDSSYYHDYMWYAGGWRVLYSGGGAYFGSYDGLFCFSVDADSSLASADVGGRLYYTPDNN